MYAKDFRLNKNKEEELNCQTYKIENCGLVIINTKTIMDMLAHGSVVG
jgi:phage gp45-like